MEERGGEGREGKEGVGRLEGKEGVGGLEEAVVH